MQYKICGDTVVLRLERGEEIHPCIEKLCTALGIKAGTVVGIGAVDCAEIGRFLVEEKRYHPTVLRGEMELAALTGNLSTKEGEVYLHLHATLGGEDGRTWSGHLSRARISATGEIFIRRLDTTIERSLCDEVGIQLMVL